MFEGFCRDGGRRTDDCNVFDEGVEDVFLFDNEVCD